jgi:serine/threonine protein kinase
VSIRRVSKIGRHSHVQSCYRPGSAHDAISHACDWGQPRLSITLPENKLRDLPAAERSDLTERVRSLIDYSHQEEVIDTVDSIPDRRARTKLQIPFWTAPERNSTTVSVLRQIQEGEFNFREVVSEPAKEMPAALSWWAGLEPKPDVFVPSEEIFRRDRLRRTFVSYNSKRSGGIVFHVGSRSDLVSQRALEPFRAMSGVVEQRILSEPDEDLIFSLRRLVYKTLADDLMKYDEQDESEPGLVKRMRVLEDVLIGLESLHAQNRVHGDLRPENITIGRNGAPGLVDYLLRPPVTRLSPEQRTYIAPEAFSHKPQYASDVFAFGKLAQRLLGSYLWDNRKLPNGLDNEMFEWVLDYCTLQDPADRPSVAMLRGILFGSQAEIRRKSASAVARGSRTALKHWTTAPTPTFAKFASLAERAEIHVEASIARYPETYLAISTQRKAASLIERIALDYAGESLHNPGQEAVPDESRDSKLDKLSQINPSIDLPLTDHIHRLHFGIGIPLDLVQKTKPGILPSRRRRFAEYEEHLALVNEARETVLGKDEYMYTAGVAKRLSSSTSHATESDVATLRRWKRLLAVSDHGRWLYPSFQFEPTEASVSPLVQKVNDRFQGSDAWEVLSWWFLPRISLQNHSLASVLHAPEGEATVQRALTRVSAR